MCVFVLNVSDVHHNIPVYLRNLEAKPRFTTGKEDSDPRIVYILEGKCLVHIFERKKKLAIREHLGVLLLKGMFIPY